MSIIGTARFTERIKFFEGQRLFASDLQDLERFNREMRWLHNQSLHQPGVASGYAVTGNKDDREVTIQPGYAIDSTGREIVLTRPETLQVPPVANDGRGNPAYYDLTVAYDEQPLEETETRDGVCASRSAIRLRERPVFCWVVLVSSNTGTGPGGLAGDLHPRDETLGKQLESGARIRLARAEVLNCKLNRPLSVVQRRNAKPPTQPYLSAGRTPTATSRWDAKVTSSGILLTLPVDTTAGRFRTKPDYVAHAIGSREVDLRIDGKDEKLVLDGFTRVEDATSDRFTFSLLIPANLIDRRFSLDKVAAALIEDPPPPRKPPLKEWYVEWLGIEG